MKCNCLRHLAAVVSALVALAMNAADKGRGADRLPAWYHQAVAVAERQLLLADSLLGAAEQPLPRSTWTDYDSAFVAAQMRMPLEVCSKRFTRRPASDKAGSLRACGIYDWTSGFYPGSLWYAYELTGNDALRQLAVEYTNILAPVQHVTYNHDVGFMINCSYGNALRLAPSDTIAPLLKTTADALCTRYNPAIGCIRSWDFGQWHYPVIIDNMMNLELLFNVSALTGDARYSDIAVAHATTTMRNHFRPDYTTYHVVSYNDDGTIESKGTHQGRADDSAWARGQAWAIYGYTMCYRETAIDAFLQQAIAVADMIMDQVDTADKIPYWDYSAPHAADTPRDASAAAITASAMLDLCQMAPDGDKYRRYAEQILESLASPQYMAVDTPNHGFILMHSTGSLPEGIEIDTPLNYADYYFLEALSRYKALKDKEIVEP